MLKAVVAIAASLMLVFPVFTNAADRGVLNDVGQFLAGEACLVPVYHTEFAFPPEGGQLVQKNGQLYFYRNYLPDCADYLSGGQVVSSAATNNNSYTNYNSNVSSDNGVLNNVGQFLAGEACLVPVYHTEFAFPPEGGQLVQKNGQLYFYRNYLPDCANAAAGAQIVSSTNNSNYYQPVSASPNNVNYSSNTYQAVPRFVAPQTGCN